VKKQARNRKPDGKFRPGQSGNPAGRPRGSRNKVTAAYLDLLDDAGGEILERAIALAKKGDRVALRLCLDRLLPAKHDRVVEFDLPRVQKAADIATAMAAVIEAVAAGSMTMEEAKQLAGLLEGQRRALETSELAVQLKVIEDQLATSRKEWEQ